MEDVDVSRRRNTPLGPTRVHACLSCGACCTQMYDYEAIADLIDVDIARLSRHYRERNVVGAQHGNPQMRARWDESAEISRCVALRGRVGAEVRCHIYDVRPEICRDFLVGDSRCNDARHELGLAPLR